MGWKGGRREERGGRREWLKGGGGGKRGEVGRVVLLCGEECEIIVVYASWGCGKVELSVWWNH